METIKLQAQRLDVEFAAAEADAESRTIPVQWYSGATVLQFNFTNGLHNLKLSTKPEHVRLDKLNSGRAAFTLGHADPNNPDAVIGVIEKDSASMSGGNGKAMIRFAKNDPTADRTWNKIEQGILPNVSLEAFMHKLKEITAEGDKIRTFLAVDWEPFAIASVATGADPNAHFAAPAIAECEIEFSVVARASAQKEQMMEDTISNAGDQARDQVELAAKEALAGSFNSGKSLGVTEELARVTSINKTALALGLTAAFANKHVEARTSIEEFRKLAIDEQARIATQYGNLNQSARVTRDEADTRRELMGTAIMGMLNPRDRKADSHNAFIGLSVFQIAQESVRQQYGLAATPTKDKIIHLSMQTTADFANVLENSARKRLQQRYEYANPTYRMWAKASTTPDFKTMSRARIGEAPVFLPVPEGAQITIGTMTDSKESYALATYGRGISFTRQMLINDDLGAFNDLIGAFGVQAARLENKAVYAILTANAAMSDSVTLFNATHGNSGTGVIGNTALDAAFAAMAVQKGVDGLSVLNLTPRFIIVPKAKEQTARAALMQVGPSVKASDQNWFAGRLEVVADAELDGSSTSVWYLTADPADTPGIEYAHLEGQEGPQFIRKENESGILGIQFYAYLDFGAKAIDWRPLYYSTGS